MLLPQTLALKKDYWLYEKIRVIIPSYHVLHVPELAQDAGPLPRLTVGHHLLLVQARQQPSPRLDQEVGRSLKLLKKKSEIMISRGNFKRFSFG